MPGRYSFIFSNIKVFHLLDLKIYRIANHIKT
jgi:hypothetical protein